MLTKNEREPIHDCIYTSRLVFLRVVIYTCEINELIQDLKKQLNYYTTFENVVRSVKSNVARFTLHYVSNIFLNIYIKFNNKII